MKLNSKVLIYDSPQISKIFNLQFLLGRYILKDTYIGRQVVNAHTLQSCMDDDTCLFILPGARASSAYRDELSGSNLQHLKKHMARGMKVLGLCAGAYVLSREFDFTFYDETNGAVLERRHVTSPLGMVDAHAYGPDLRLYVPQAADGSLQLYNAATLDFNGMSTKALVCKAPSFSQYNPRQCEPVATYNASNETAILRILKSDGEIAGILSGPSIEVGGEGLDLYIPQGLQDANVKKTVLELNEARDSRRHLLAQVFGDLLPQIAPQIRRNLGLV